MRSIRKSEKLRRHSGRKVGRIAFPFSRDWIINQCLEPQEYWDDWSDYRDGFRGSNDRKLLRSKYMTSAKYLNVERWNKKLRTLIERRRARQVKLNCPLF